MDFGTAIGEGNAATAIVDHVRQILRELVLARVVRIARHHCEKITPIDYFPSLANKDECFGWPGLRQIRGLEKNAIGSDKSPAAVGTGEATQIHIHRYAANARLSDTVDRNIRFV